MSNDEYVGSIINKYALLTAPTPAGAAAAQAVFPLIQQWAGKIPSQGFVFWLNRQGYSHLRHH